MSEMNAEKAREIVRSTNLLAPQSNFQMEQYFEARGYLIALEGPEAKAKEQEISDLNALLKEAAEALEYCAIDPGLLRPENNRQCAVAMNTVAKIREKLK